MISDTLVAFLIFVMPEMTEVNNGRQHKFRELFEQAARILTESTELILRN